MFVEVNQGQAVVHRAAGEAVMAANARRWSRPGSRSPHLFRRAVRPIGGRS